VSANLNLASQPFRNRTLPWTITAIVTVASLFALVLIVRASIQMNSQADLVERDVKSLRQQMDALQKKAADVKEALTPEQVQLLQSAHALDDRKRFSWSRLFADLEASLPASVRVSRINVRDVVAEGDRTVAELDLTVIGKNTSDVTEMISQMDRQGIFQAEPVSQNLQRGRGQLGTEWTLLVRYMPRPGAPTRAQMTPSLATRGMTPATASNGGAP
jgi:Tfp pilus assembly protein PilN